MRVAAWQRGAAALAGADRALAPLPAVLLLLGRPGSCLPAAPSAAARLPRGPPAGGPRRRRLSSCGVACA